MPKDLSELETRIIRKEEVVQKINLNKRVKPYMVEKIAERFIDPETQQPIQIGEAVEFGPYESKLEGTNWFKYYMRDVYTSERLNWGKERTQGNHRKSPVAIDPQERDGKWYVWIIRIGE